MRDSPGFKIISELKAKNFEVFGYDPYYKPQLIEKYLKENFMEKLEFNYIKKLDGDMLKKSNCICIVQHHTKSKLKLNEIYEKSLIPIIYDCQNKLEKIRESKTILESLGNSLQA